jgi:hypothetical protein
MVLKYFISKYVKLMIEELFWCLPDREKCRYAVACCSCLWFSNDSE